LAFNTFADFCFRTYGLGLPDIEIYKINSGLELSIDIKNNGTLTANYVNLSNDIEDGIILRGQSDRGVIPELDIGESYIIPHRTFGIGSVIITVTTDDAVKQATAFLFGSLVLSLEET
jgi:hypothetical protein